MSSAALDTYNEFLDDLGLDAKVTADLKARGKQLYRDASLEHIEHLKFHADIVAAAEDESAEAKARASQVADVAASLLAKGKASGWFDLLQVSEVAAEEIAR